MPPLVTLVLGLFAVGVFLPVMSDAVDDDAGLGLSSYLLLGVATLILGIVLLAEADVPRKLAEAYTAILAELGRFFAPLLKLLAFV